MKVYKFECESCGSKKCVKIDDGYKCEYCGSVQDVIMSPEQININIMDDGDIDFDSKTELNGSRKSILIRLLICIFAGYLGIHKFLEGKIFLGIVYIFTYGLFGIGMVIDIIRYIIDLAHTGKYKR